MTDRDDFLSRWSSRKRKAREEAALSADEPLVEETDVSPETAAPEKTDEEILEELGLPSPETLMKGDSIIGFLQANVPKRLRNRALKRLWLTDPVFANLDGLNDYDGDYTDAATVMTNLRSAYKAGRGFLREEVVRGVEADEAGPGVEVAHGAGEPGRADGDEALADEPRDLAGEVGSVEEEAASGVSAAVDEGKHPTDPELAPADGQEDEGAAGAEREDAYDIPTPSRMQFHFDDG